MTISKHAASVLLAFWDAAGTRRFLSLSEAMIIPGFAEALPELRSLGLLHGEDPIGYQVSGDVPVALWAEAVALATS